MNHKLISLRIILFLLLLYYLRHCAPTLYSYGPGRAVPAGNFKTLLVAIQSASLLMLQGTGASTTHLRDQLGHPRSQGSHLMSQK